MTYILGVKYDSTVILCADTAVTTDSDATDIFQYDDAISSFGERHFCGKTRRIQEGALKLLRIGNVFLAIAGDARIGYAFADASSKQYVTSDDPVVAFRLVAQTLPVSDSDIIQLALAVPASNGARLFTLNDRPRSGIEEWPDETIVQLGSVPKHFEDLSVAFASTFRPWQTTPHTLLMLWLALLQSYGLREYVIQHGFGGTFCGGITTPNGAAWQQDVLYYLYATEGQPVAMVTTSVRDHSVVVHSTASGSLRAFGWSRISTEPFGTTAWFDVEAERIKDPRYGFVAFLSIDEWAFTVFEMKGQQRAKHIEIRTSEVKDPDGTKVEILFSPTAQAAISKTAQPAEPQSSPGWVGVKFSVFPYEPALITPAHRDQDAREFLSESGRKRA